MLLAYLIGAYLLACVRGCCNFIRFWGEWRSIFNLWDDLNYQALNIVLVFEKEVRKTWLDSRNLQGAAVVVYCGDFESCTLLIISVPMSLHVSPEIAL